jgi:hypothetical protein
MQPLQPGGGSRTGGCGKSAEAEDGSDEEDGLLRSVRSCSSRLSIR